MPDSKGFDTGNQLKDDTLYYEYLVSRYKNPKNRGKIENADIIYEEGNPSCGDVIKIYVKLSEDKKVIEDVKFEGYGCTISQVSADILADLVKGKTIDEARNFSKETLLEELGIELSPIRLKCALLSYKVFKMGAYGIKVDIDHS